ncbi:TPA: type II toxin-antitoxin system RelE/ParE family toxin [Haemophilus influenzae]
MKLAFVELPFFEKYRAEYLLDDEYRALQNELLENPEKGDLIQGSNGLRKIRVANSKRNKGKRGGARAIYYHYINNKTIYFFTIYGKETKDDLKPEELKVLAQLANSIKKITGATQ